MFVAKRKRAQNFTQEEKLQFVRLLQEHGQCIITKVTLHDMQTNKDKEVIWQKITEYLNANANIKRTTETLKKLWQKLKSDAKVYKAKSRYITGTGGGPSKSMDDPVLELVVEITGRGSSGIQMVQDCDADDIMVSADAVLPNVAVVTENIIIEDNIIYEEFPDKEITVINNDMSIDEACTKEETPKGKDWLKRRQPELLKSNERSFVLKAKTKLNNRFATERLRVETEKSELISLQKKQMMELHEIKMENERLKKSLLKKLINKLDSDKVAVQPVLSVLSTISATEDNIN